MCRGEWVVLSLDTVPVVLKYCSELIEMYGVVDGIYRLSGISSNIQRLRLLTTVNSNIMLTAPLWSHMQ